MTTSRIARLAQAVGRPVPRVGAEPPDPRSPVRKTRRAAARRAPVSRGFDTGGQIAVHAVVVGEAPGASAVRQEVDGGSAGWTVLPTGDASVPVGGGHLGPMGSVGAVGSVPSAGQAGAAPAATDGDLDVMQMSAPASASAGGGGGEDVAGWTVTAPPELDDDEAFAQDIHAILAHAKSVSTPDRRMPLPAVPQAAPQPLPAAPQNGIGAGAGHDVFEQMAAANAPDRFDQGPVSLSVDFARLDQAMADTPAATEAPAAAEAPAVAEAPAATQAPPATEAPAAEKPATAETPTPPAAGVPTPAAEPPAPEPAAPTTSPTGFKVTTDVPLLPQQPGLSCHAAACASMVAWRDEITPDPAEVASASGYWERFADGRTAVYPEVLDVFGLELAAVGNAPTAAQLGDLIDTHGPLFVCGSPPAEHAVVVSGISSDGTDAVVDVVDPWAPGMTTYAAPNTGSAGPMAYPDLVAGLGAGPEHHLLLAHLRKGSS